MNQTLLNRHFLNRNGLVTFTFVLITGLFGSCTAERKLAKAYIQMDKEVTFMILPTQFVFKENLKRFEAGDTSGMRREQIDSLLFANSLFLREISDSVFLEQFTNSLIEELEKLGYSVVMDNAVDTFLFLKSPAYIFNIAQILLEEHYNVHKAEEEIGDFVYYKSIDVNALTYNFWFELSEMNNPEREPGLLYVAETINDVVSGYFTQSLFTGDVQYKYLVNEIDLEVVYRYSSLFGERIAGYLHDYLMNEYIRVHWPHEGEPRMYMHYNRRNKTLDPTLSERFLEMN